MMLSIWISKSSVFYTVIRCDALSVVFYIISVRDLLPCVIVLLFMMIIIVMGLAFSVYDAHFLKTNFLVLRNKDLIDAAVFILTLIFGAVSADLITSVETF